MPNTIVRMVASALLVSLASIHAGSAGAGSAFDKPAAASALLAVDQNRATIVERIVGEWGERLSSSARISLAELSEMLFAMRADQLLAASLAGSLEGLRDVIAQALVAPSGPKATGLLRAQSTVGPQALGDSGLDLVYVPVTPCRLVETRTSYAAVHQGGGAFAANEIRSYIVQGGNGVCLTQLPGGTNPAAIQLQVFGIPQNGVSGDVEVLPQGSAFGNSATLVFLGSIPFTSASTTTRVNPGNNQIAVQVRTGVAHVAVDVVGYFHAPQGGYVTSVVPGSGITVGGTASNPSIAANTTYLQRRVSGTCAAGTSIRTINADGTVVCETDDGGTGSVTGVTASAPLASSGGSAPNISLSGSIPVSSGGTGQATLATNAILFGQGTGAVGTAVGSLGQVLTGAAGAPTWSGSPYLSGNLGIGVPAPGARLDVLGGNWDVAGGEGDVRVGNPTYRLKMGVATAGGGAGAARIMQQGVPGGYNVLALGAQGNSILFINGGSQRAGIGTDAPNAPLGFPPALGKKITLYPGASGDAGFGIAGNRLQIYADNPNADVALGWDAAGTFNERLAVKPTGALAVSGDTGLPGQVLRSGGPASTAQWQPLGNVLQTQFNNSNQASTLLTAASQTFTFTAHSYNVVASGDARLIINAVFFFRNPGCFACPESQDRIFVRVNGVEAKGYHFVYTPNNFWSTFTVGNLMYDVPPGNHAITFDAFHYSFAADSYAFIDSSSVMVLPR